MESKKKRVLKFLILPVLLVVFFLFLFFFFRIERVTVTGCSYYTEEEIKDMIFTSSMDYNSLYLYIKHKFIGTREMPFIQKLTITRKGSREVTIRVYEKALAGCVKYMNQYIYFDKDGIVLECAEKAIEGIPCVTGVEYQGFTLYARLEVADEGIFERILDLSQLLQKYEIFPDRIHFAKDGTVMLEVSGIKIYLGEQEFYDEQVASLAEVLPTAVEENLKGRIHMENYTSGQDIIFNKD